MAMYGIDVSSNQPASIVKDVKNDFAIVKLTGNPQAYSWDYVNPYAAQQAKDAMAKHGRLGLYHFTWGKADPTTEADYFIKHVKRLGYIGKAMLVIDYEAEAVDKGAAWVKKLAQRIEKLAGYKPVIYASGSVIVSQNLFALGYPIWCANYSRGYDRIDGYSTNGCAIYGGCQKSALWQFTSSGYLDGYNGPLDLNVFFGSSKDWTEYSGPSKQAASSTSTASTSTKAATAADVIKIARAEIGNTDGAKYGKWYETNIDRNVNNYDFSAFGVPWCAMFVSWVFAKAGAKCAGLPGAYCPTMVSTAKTTSKTVSLKNAKRGDVVYFDWDSDGIADHVGIVVDNDYAGRYMATIEGNTDTTYGIVAKKTRPYGSVCAVVRPDYGGSVAPDSSTKLPITFRLSIYQDGKKWMAAGKKYAKSGAPIRWIAIKNVKRYRVHTAASGWLPWVSAYNIKDLVDGCAGDGTPINGIQVDDTACKYAVRVMGAVWYPYMRGLVDTGGSGDNFAGDLANAIDGFRIEQ